VAKKEAPAPKNPKGVITVLVVDVPAGPGIGSAQAPVEVLRDWGVGENMFYSSDMQHIVDYRLCTSYEVAEDLSYAILHVRPGVQFHYGWGEFTAEDAVWSMNDANAYTNPTSIHGQAGDFAALFKEWEVVDPYTVKANFQEYDIRWNANFLNENSQGLVFFSKKIYDEKGENWMMDHIISTGPMQVVEWVRDDHAYLEAVPYTHWRMNPKMSQIRFLEVPEESTRIAMLKTGEADVADIAIKNLKSMLEEGFKTFGTGAGNQIGIWWSGNLWETTYAGGSKAGQPLPREGYGIHDLAWIGNTLNCPEIEEGWDGKAQPAWDSAQCKDPGDMEEARQVRWALAEAFDREAINEAVMSGLGWPVYVEYAQVHSPDLWESKWEIPYNLESAKARLAKTAWPDGFEIALWIQMPHAIRPEVGDAVAGYWLKLGSKMTVEVIKSAYTIVRPSLVGRTLSLPIVMECDEGRTAWPPDWPKGMVATSLTRGGFGCGNESPYIAQAYLKTRAELDRDKRIQINKGVIDHMWYWQVGTGIVAQPVVFTYNPKSIKEWTSDVEFWGESMFGIYNAVPADR